ncbi:hypothetical protein ACFL9U_14855 [Thermodesulfobacteriota bacterium]
MKKSTVAFILVILALGAYFAYDSQWGKSLMLGVFSKDRDTLNQMSLSFMEDIKFKDFKKAATYHHPEDQKKQNIPKLIERLFKIKPEFLDIMEYNILETSLDSSRKRGRVKLKAKVNVLNSNKIKNPELILYFHNKNGKWYMELESSLK